MRVGVGRWNEVNEGDVEAVVVYCDSLDQLPVEPAHPEPLPEPPAGYAQQGGVPIRKLMGLLVDKFIS